MRRHRPAVVVKGTQQAVLRARGALPTRPTRRAVIIPRARRAAVPTRRAPQAEVKKPPLPAEEAPCFPPHARLISVGHLATRAVDRPHRAIDPVGPGFLEEGSGHGIAEGVLAEGEVIQPLPVRFCPHRLQAGFDRVPAPADTLGTHRCTPQGGGGVGDTFPQVFLGFL